ncbi:DUF3298 and DUF4163 domain-containing protein [Dyadobacter sp. CY356]|uniref:DUF3298 and DUF4163 domain-containing protein n=1 Tax=Dyadobacter sp. CY356 TaxID=2906442 RepID=UPI001F459168|nr:DUF3298 and DUF4163 domain-containing protein [Dyadobacter sp. CY356]MCF0054480.1 DUF3298 and DUF4163 domain-containing protein [Dyadobacter sp. CY356]
MHIFPKLLIFSILIFFYACTSSTKKEEVKTERAGKFNKMELGNCDTTLIGGVSLRINVWEPVGQDTAAGTIRAFLNQKLIDRINDYADSASIAAHPGSDKSIRNAYDVFSSNYTKFKTKFPEAPGCWEVDLKGDTVMVSPKIMQYQMDHYSYTGGAHPNTFRTYYVFNITTGKELKSTTFLSDSVALLKKVEKSFRKLENIADTTNLENAGYFLMNHKFFLPANYAFTREGIFFYYNPYEIAAYARGAITFTIPYSELEGIVKKELIF